MATHKMKKRLFWGLLVGGVVAGSIVFGYAMLRPPPFSGLIGKRAPDIHLPDALIRSHSLSKLPPDLLRIPLARDVLTEDFVAYYEQNENRVALSGTLRRIAFEHKLDLPESLLKSVFDEPAEVALWRDDAGRLKDFVIVLSRNTLARVIQTVLPIAAKASDAQLSSAGTLDGTDVEILVLQYGIGHHLLLLSKGDRIVVLSNAGMLFAPPEKEEAEEAAPQYAETQESADHCDEEGCEGEEETGQQPPPPPPPVRPPPPQLEKAVAFVKELLDGEKTVSPFAQRFSRAAPLPEKKHELTFGTRSFALNYETFVPGLAALDLSFDNQGKWQSAVLLDGANWRDDGNKNLWTALPHGAGFCAVLPVNWTQMAALREKFDSTQKPKTDLEGHVIPEEATGTEKPAENFAANFSGPAAVCWYKDSRLYKPLFAARLNAEADEKKIREFFDLFDLAVRTARVKEVKSKVAAPQEPQKAEQVSRSEEGQSADADKTESPPATQTDNREKGEPSTAKNAPALWQGDKIASRFDLEPALAVQGDIVFFSPDAALVKQALDVATKRWPALSDSFSSERDAPLVFIDPKALASLLRTEIFIALPRDEETLFRNAAETYLVPRLNALARYPAQDVGLAKKAQGKGRNWYPLEWKARPAR